MTSDSRVLIAGMRAWLAVENPLAFATPGESHSTLLRFSRAIHKLLKMKPSHQVLSRTAVLFDELTAQPIHDDWYGERREIALTLSFLGWKHSYLLGQEGRSLEWLGITDGLLTEETAELSRLENFLYLAATEKSESLWEFFLTSDLDLYLALAILRRDRLSKPTDVIRSAIEIHQWLTDRRPDGSSMEHAFFCTEAAWLIAAELRMLGQLTETRKWLAVAKRERRRMHVSSALRVKLQLVTLLISREAHRYRQLLARFAALRERCLSLGLYREALTCRYGAAMTEKVIGHTEIACAEFEAIFQETQNTSFGTLAGLSLGHVAKNLAERGLADQAEAAFSLAIDLVQATGDSVNIGSLILEIGDTQLSCGRPCEAAHLFQIAATHYSRANAGYWQAYAQLLMADALLDDGRPAEALRAVAVSFPLIKRESMRPEGVHALQILNRIASRTDIRKGPIFEFLAEMCDTTQ